jgi:hypothetical protein
MPHWLSITLAIICLVLALQQIRMMFIYLGVIPHPFIPRGLRLAFVAIRSAVNWAIRGGIVLCVPWPRLLTYFFGLIVCMTVVDTILGLFGIGLFGDMIESQFHLKRQGLYLASKIVVFGIITWLSIYFLGFR